MRREHLLLVDDSAAVTAALEVLFAESGYRVTVADSIASAVRAGRDDRADILLLDLTLGDDDGLDVLQQLREAGAEPRATVVMTGHDSDTLRDRCFAAGCRDVLLKPVPIRELLERVRSL